MITMIQVQPIVSFHVNLALLYACLVAQLINAIFAKKGRLLV